MFSERCMHIFSDFHFMHCLDRFTLDYKKDEKLVLPTAPKAARGPDFDLSKVPTSPPFTAFLGNLPYDVQEDDIVMFFRQLQVCIEK